MKKPFAVAGLIYFILTCVLLSYLQNYSDNPDTFQYISIAKKYLNLDWAHAVNAYWSPFISWLLVVPIVVMPNAVIAFKILQVGIGIFVLFQWCRLIKVTSIEILQFVLAIIATPFLVSYAMLNSTPDLLFTGMILWLLNIFKSGNITTELRTAFSAGVAGAFMYYTKAFGLPLFIALSLTVIFLESRKGKINSNAILLMFSTFLLLCGIWIANISIHSGEFTISKSAEFN